MKLLFDQNLSRNLAKHLCDLFPDSAHVVHHGLDHAEDEPVWEFAKQNDFVIVTKDGDFVSRNLTYGAPPKVVFIRLGNSSVSTILRLLRDHASEIQEFAQDPSYSLFVITGRDQGYQV